MSQEKSRLKFLLSMMSLLCHLSGSFCLYNDLICVTTNVDHFRYVLAMIDDDSDGKTVIADFKEIVRFLLKF